MEQRQPDSENDQPISPRNSPSVEPDVPPAQSGDQRSTDRPEASVRPQEPRERDDTPPNEQPQPGGSQAENAPDHTHPQGIPKENNSREQPPRENRQRDGAPRDGALRDGGSRDKNRREGGPREGGPREGVARETNARAGEPRENRQREGGPREGAPRDGGPRDVPRDSADDRPDGAERPGSGRAEYERNGAERPAQERLVIGITLGDYNGVGPEVILKALQYNQLQKICTPVIYGSMRVLNRYRNQLNLKDWNLNGIQHVGQASHKMTNVITCWNDQNQDVQPGKVTPEAGQAAFACLQRAVDDMKAGKLDALVTAPINKHTMQSEVFAFPGHTEYLASEFGGAENLMFMVSEGLRVGVVTAHIPIAQVSAQITRDRIAKKLELMLTSLKQDFGINKPKIAVLGLNPHAGENGLLGNEEGDTITPLLNDLRHKGQLVFGPYPADGFFGTRAYRKFDAVLAMYHDQGLIPFKAIAFDEGVNFTAGMPVVRTSPDHGTAYDIAGKGVADETSFIQAIYTACAVARQRRDYKEIEDNALKARQSVEK